MNPDYLAQFDALIDRATTVRVMDFDSAGRDAYEAANEVLVGEVDRMIAVWDGQDGQRAGTGTVVASAREPRAEVIAALAGLSGPAGAQLDRDDPVDDSLYDPYDRAYRRGEFAGDGSP
ncbi:hypothetical protein [Nocardia sp. NPDC058666]|uniref:hypothetical protein n=1 Tax=Nocardia sp. NPDC058666 TaxID=3346587 RepID=UPI00365C3546